MPSLFRVTGPIDVYVRFNANQGGLTQYLGTATTAPEVEGRPSFLSVINDKSSRTVPMQKVYDGEQDVVTMTLNRFDYVVYQSLRNNSTRAASTVGTDGPLARGNLMINNNDFNLILVYTFFGTVNATVDLPPGRFYNSALLTGYRESTVGTRVEEVALVFECNGVFQTGSGTGTSGPYGANQLYTESPGFFASLSLPAPS
jgi:hypothetical protein